MMLHCVLAVQVDRVGKFKGYLEDRTEGTGLCVSEGEEGRNRG